MSRSTKVLNKRNLPRITRSHRATLSQWNRSENEIAGGYRAISLYKILQLPILCGVYCNNGGSGGNVIFRNSADGDGVGWGA